MVQHVLLTTDLSEPSRRAYDPALQLAAALGARVTLLSVVQMLIDGEPVGMHATPIALGDPEQERASALEQLAGERKTLVERAPELEIDVDAVTGTAIAPAILTWAEEHGVDLIVLATHGRGGIRRLVMGSVAELVLRHAHVPVLCVPPTA